MAFHGDPDDYGLPKVDIVVPNDARELDRDVLAYRRELRQRRRRERLRRLARPFTRYGIATPFIASAVLVALISGLLMTVVSPRPAPRTIQVPPTTAQRSRPGDTGAGLPSGDLVVDGKQTPIPALIDRAGVVQIVPRDCRCDAAVTHLGQQAAAQRLQVWLVADGRQGRDADDLHRLAALVPHAAAIAADDPARVLSTAYRATRLSAVLVGPDRVVRDILRDVRAERDFTPDLRPLQTPN